MELVILDADGTQRARHVFLTNRELTRDNVAAYIDAGRARWKVENEHNNTLKTKGYNLEHNFGHGKNNLSNLLFESWEALMLFMLEGLDLEDPGG